MIIDSLRIRSTIARMRTKRAVFLGCLAAAIGIATWTAHAGADTDRKSIEQLLDRYLRSVNEASLPIADAIWSHAADVVVVTPFGRFQGWAEIRTKIYVDFLQKAF